MFLGFPALALFKCIFFTHNFYSGSEKFQTAHFEIRPFFKVWFWTKLSVRFWTNFRSLGTTPISKRPSRSKMATLGNSWNSGAFSEQLSELHSRPKLYEATLGVTPGIAVWKPKFQPKFSEHFFKIGVVPVHQTIFLVEKRAILAQNLTFNLLCFNKKKKHKMRGPPLEFAKTEELKEKLVQNLSFKTPQNGPEPNLIEYVYMYIYIYILFILCFHLEVSTLALSRWLVRNCLLLIRAFRTPSVSSLPLSDKSHLPLSL